MNWKEKFEKKHWGAMFEDGDYNALLEDIQTEIIEKLIEDACEQIFYPDIKRQELRAKWLEEK